MKTGGNIEEVEKACAVFELFGMLLDFDLLYGVSEILSAVPCLEAQFVFVDKICPFS